MIMLGKRKFDGKLEDVSIKVIKKPKQDFQSSAGLPSNNSTTLGKTIGIVADPSKRNGVSKIVHLKIMKPPLSFPTLSTFNNMSSPSRNIIVKNGGNSIKKVIDIKPIQSLVAKPLADVKPIMVSNLLSPKPTSSFSLTSLRISKHVAPLNSITNIVMPIKQEKEIDATQKKKECIIKPLNLPKNFFFQNNSNAGTIKTTTQHQGMKIISLQNIKQEKVFRPIKPFIVVSPMNHLNVKQEGSRMGMEDLMIKSPEKLQEEPAVQEFIQPLLWYDEKEEHFNALNFPTDSPIYFLKSMLVTGNYLSEDDAVNYSYQSMENKLRKDFTMRECGVEHIAVDIKFVFNKDRTDVTTIVIYEVVASTVGISATANDDQNNSVGATDFKKRRNTLGKKRKDKNSAITYDKGGRIQLWQFLLTTLLERQHPDKIEWMSDDGEFRFGNPDPFAKVWGAFKGKKNMTYNNLSRAIRYYYEMGIMNKVKGFQFRYKFTLDIKATTGYTFSELRRLYEKTSMNPNDPDFGRFIALRELLSSPISAQTGAKKFEEPEVLIEHRSEFDEEMNSDQSFYNLEDQLASTNLAQLCFPTSDEAYMSFSLEDSS